MSLTPAQYAAIQRLADAMGSDRPDIADRCMAALNGSAFDAEWAVDYIEETDPETAEGWS